MHTTARLTRNTFWNIVGQTLPIAAAIIATPVLMAKLGQERFGLLTMAWVLVGYSSLFDFGVGRALTTLVAGALGSGNIREIPALVWTSLIMMFGLGVLGAAVVSLAGPWFVRHLLHIPAALGWEMIEAIWVLSAAIPIIIGSAGLVGILEASQRFDLINAVRGPLGAASYLGPLAIALAVPNLVAIAIFLAASRFVAAIVYLWLCWHVQPELKDRPVFAKSILPKVLTLGGWMTVTNLISPLMASVDRFFVGALISATGVAYYATSQDVVVRSAILPVALTGALFPSFAGAASSRQVNVTLFGRALDYMWLLTFPLALLLVGVAREGLTLWLGKDFAENATLPFQILACGMFVNSLARVPFTYVQASSRPDLTAKAHLMELPVYVVLLVGLTMPFGLVGVALAWSLRALADAAILFYLSYRLTQELWPFIRRLAKLTLPACMSFVLMMVPAPTGLRYAMLATMFSLSSYLSWTGLLTPEEQIAVRRVVGSWRKVTLSCAQPPEMGS